MSHDRTFSETVATSIVELDGGALYEHSTSQGSLVEAYLQGKATRLADARSQASSTRKQLEVELARCEEDRATMEENLSQSFNTVIKELVASVASLQEQKRDLLVRIEDQSGKKGGLFTKT